MAIRPYERKKTGETVWRSTVWGLGKAWMRVFPTEEQAQEFEATVKAGIDPGPPGSACDDRWEATRVPAELLFPYVDEYLKRKDMGAMTLADLIGIGSARRKAVSWTPGDPEHMVPFDLADRIICWVSHPFVWQTDPKLAKVYQSLDLRFLDQMVGHRKTMTARGHRRCKRKACSNEFRLKPKGQNQRFCSDACKAATWKEVNVGIKTRRRGPGRKLEKMTCTNGHQRSPETSYLDTAGSLICRECKRASTRRWRANRKAAKV